VSIPNGRAPSAWVAARRASRRHRSRRRSRFVAAPRASSEQRTTRRDQSYRRSSRDGATIAIASVAEIERSPVLEEVASVDRKPPLPDEDLKPHRIRRRREHGRRARLGWGASLAISVVHTTSIVVGCPMLSSSSSAPGFPPIRFATVTPPTARKRRPDGSRLASDPVHHLRRLHG